MHAKWILPVMLSWCTCVCPSMQPLTVGNGSVELKNLQHEQLNTQRDRAAGKRFLFIIITV